jgi:hypothetical protein
MYAQLPPLLPLLLPGKLPMPMPLPAKAKAMLITARASKVPFLSPKQALAEAVILFSNWKRSGGCLAQNAVCRRCAVCKRASTV